MKKRNGGQIYPTNGVAQFGEKDLPLTSVLEVGVVQKPASDVSAADAEPSDPDNSEAGKNRSTVIKGLNLEDASVNLTASTTSVAEESAAESEAQAANIGNERILDNNSDVRVGPVSQPSAESQKALSVVPACVASTLTTNSAVALDDKANAPVNRADVVNVNTECVLDLISKPNKVPSVRSAASGLAISSVYSLSVHSSSDSTNGRTMFTKASRKQYFSLSTDSSNDCDDDHVAFNRPSMITQNFSESVSDDGSMLSNATSNEQAKTRCKTKSDSDLKTHNRVSGNDVVRSKISAINSSTADESDAPANSKANLRCPENNPDKECGDTVLFSKPDESIQCSKLSLNQTTASSTSETTAVEVNPERAIESASGTEASTANSKLSKFAEFPDNPSSGSDGKTYDSGNHDKLVLVDVPMISDAASDDMSEGVKSSGRVKYITEKKDNFQGTKGRSDDSIRKTANLRGIVPVTRVVSASQFASEARLTKCIVRLKLLKKSQMESAVNASTVAATEKFLSSDNFGGSSCASSAQRHTLLGLTDVQKQLDVTPKDMKKHAEVLEEGSAEALDQGSTGALKEGSAEALAEESDEGPSEALDKGPVEFSSPVTPDTKAKSPLSPKSISVNEPPVSSQSLDIGKSVAQREKINNNSRKSSMSADNFTSEAAAQQSDLPVNILPATSVNDDHLEQSGENLSSSPSLSDEVCHATGVASENSDVEETNGAAKPDSEASSKNDISKTKQDAVNNDQGLGECNDDQAEVSANQHVSSEIPHADHDRQSITMPVDLSSTELGPQVKQLNVELCGPSDTGKLLESVTSVKSKYSSKNRPLKRTEKADLLASTHVMPDRPHGDSKSTSSASSDVPAASLIEKRCTTVEEASSSTTKISERNDAASNSLAESNDQLLILNSSNKVLVVESSANNNVPVNSLLTENVIASKPVPKSKWVLGSFLTAKNSQSSVSKAGASPQAPANDHSIVATLSSSNEASVSANIANTPRKTLQLKDEMSVKEIDSHKLLPSLNKGTGRGNTSIGSIKEDGQMASAPSVCKPTNAVESKIKTSLSVLNFRDFSKRFVAKLKQEGNPAAEANGAIAQECRIANKKRRADISKNSSLKRNSSKAVVGDNNFIQSKKMKSAVLPTQPETMSSLILPENLPDSTEPKNDTDQIPNRTAANVNETLERQGSLSIPSGKKIKLSSSMEIFEVKKNSSGKINGSSFSSGTPSKLSESKNAQTSPNTKRKSLSKTHGQTTRSRTTSNQSSSETKTRFSLSSTREQNATSSATDVEAKKSQLVLDSKRQSSFVPRKNSSPKREGKSSNQIKGTLSSQKEGIASPQTESQPSPLTEGNPMSQNRDVPSSREKEKLSLQGKNKSSSNTKNTSSSETKDKSSSETKDKSSETKDKSSSETKDKSSSEKKDKSSSEKKDKSSSETKDKSSPETKDKSSSETKDKSSSETKDKSSSETKDKSSSETKDKSSSETEVKSSSETKDKSSSEIKDKSSSETKDKSSSEIKGKSSSETKDKSSSEIKGKSSSVTKENSSSDTKDRPSYETKGKSSGTKNKSCETKSKSSEIKNDSPETKDKSSETKNNSSETKGKSSEIKDKSSETKDKSSETKDKSSETKDKSSETRDKSAETKGKSSETKDKLPETKDKSSETKDKSYKAKHSFERNSKSSAVSTLSSETKNIHSSNSKDTSLAFKDPPPYSKDRASYSKSRASHSRDRSSHSNNRSPHYSKDRTSHSKNRSSHSKDRSSHSKDRSSHSKDRSSRSKDRSSHSKNRATHSKDQTSRSKDRLSHSIDRSLHSTDKSTSKDESSHSNDNSSHSKDKLPHPKDKSYSKDRSTHSKEKSTHIKDKSSHSKDMSLDSKDWSSVSSTKDSSISLGDCSALRSRGIASECAKPDSRSNFKEKTGTEKIVFRSKSVSLSGPHPGASSKISGEPNDSTEISSDSDVSELMEDKSAKKLGGPSVLIDMLVDKSIGSLTASNVKCDKENQNLLDEIINHKNKGDDLKNLALDQNLTTDAEKTQTAVPTLEANSETQNRSVAPSHHAFTSEDNQSNKLHLDEKATENEEEAVRMRNEFGAMQALLGSNTEQLKFGGLSGTKSSDLETKLLRSEKQLPGEINNLSEKAPGLGNSPRLENLSVLDKSHGLIKSTYPDNSHDSNKSLGLYKSPGSDKPSGSDKSTVPENSPCPDKSSFSYKSPGSDHKSPGSDHKSPGSDHKSPGSDHKSPGSDHKSPGSDHESPGSDHKSPGSDHKSPGSDHELSLIHI
ncbi:mucin-12-like [Hyalella azteca]|uniref:Mucin-12-like n=1 Tax=Hyalella azteca TaxID=294128 RepID=A0A979FVB8_HYAAZ|nr:mucin-12-like [Hyalella azteca]